MFNFENLTNYAQEIVYAASAKMNSYKNPEMQPEHILIAMVEDNGIAKDYLTELKLLNQNFVNELVRNISNYPTLSGPQNGQ